MGKESIFFPEQNILYGEAREKVERDGTQNNTLEPRNDIYKTTPLRYLGNGYTDISLVDMGDITTRSYCHLV